MFLGHFIGILRATNLLPSNPLLFYEQNNVTGLIWQNRYLYNHFIKHRSSNYQAKNVVLSTFCLKLRKTAEKANVAN